MCQEGMQPRPGGLLGELSPGVMASPVALSEASNTVLASAEGTWDLFSQKAQAPNSQKHSRRENWNNRGNFSESPIKVEFPDIVQRKPKAKSNWTHQWAFRLCGTAPATGGSSLSTCWLPEEIPRLVVPLLLGFLLRGVSRCSLFVAEGLWKKPLRSSQGALTACLGKRNAHLFQELPTIGALKRRLWNR